MEIITTHASDPALLESPKDLRIQTPVIEGFRNRECFIKSAPGFESPTVNKLEEPGWFAVRAMVKRSEVIEIMEKLDALGATAILETTITNCRL